MITVIAGTNRKDARTYIVAQKYVELLKQKTDEPVKYLDLQFMNGMEISNEMYLGDRKDPTFVNVEKEYLAPADNWVVIVPEYNGTFSGIFKMFIDAISMSGFKETFKKKKVAFIGVASGRAGNLRGMDHLATAFMYLGTYVMNGTQPMSLIGNHIIEDQLDETYTTILDGHAKKYIEWVG